MCGFLLRDGLRCGSPNALGSHVKSLREHSRTEVGHLDAGVCRTGMNELFGRGFV